jgi:hypothetical protein
MDITIHSVDNKGDLTNEAIWFVIKEDINIGKYILSDTTYLESGEVSNELRHIYLFPNKNLKKGDWVVLYTKNGNNSSFLNKTKTTTHIYYWNLGHSVWNKGGDCAVLFHYDEWISKNV